MTHYVCAGDCGGSTDEPGKTCQAEGCVKFGEPLVACDCTDGAHQEAPAVPDDE